MWRSYHSYSIQIIFSVVVSLILIIATYWSLPFVSSLLERSQRQFYDIELSNTSTQANTDTIPIVLIDIDNKTLSEQGDWRRTRNEINNFLNLVSNYKPRIVALNTTFATPDFNPIDDVNDKLKELDRALPHEVLSLSDSMNVDKKLSETIKRLQVILSFVISEQPGEFDILPKGVPVPKANLQTPWKVSGYYANLNIYKKASGGEGQSSSKVDPDGVLRNLPLVLAKDKELYPSFALTIAQRYLNIPEYSLVLEEHDDKTYYKGLQLGDRFIHTDGFGQILIPYQVDLQHIHHISARDIYANKPLPILNNAIVIIGFSSSLGGSPKSTPIKANMYEFEVQGLALYGILHPETLWYNPSWSNTLIVLELIVLTLLVIWFYPRCRPHNLLVIGVALTSMIILGHYLLHEIWQAYVSPVPALFYSGFVTLLFLIASLLYENRTRLQLQYRFGQYVPSEHIQRMLDQPEAVNLEGERREMSVLFADLHDFTQIAETISTQKLKQFLNSYLTHATEVIFQKRGTIDKYIGDLIMAFWGAPLPIENHAEQSVLAALAIQAMLKEKQNDFTAFGIPVVKLGIGINTGEMNVGEMGSDYRRAYTVLGDAVNIAARIEPLTRFYQVDILVTEATKQQCPSIYFRSVDTVKVKGKQTSLMLYQPIGLKQELTSEQLKHYALYEQALEVCIAKDWAQAQRLFEEVLNVLPNDPLAKLYLQRTISCQQNSALEWNGVQNHLTKD